jgi:diadenosine tetraphosphate (Ap4A) HIT family hydrolase
LGNLPASVVLLNRNAVLPWFILVPDTELVDVLDLPGPQREQVLADCAVVSMFLKRVLGFDKVNFAGLGNVVPQMHLHIIGRRIGDPCWPQPVWGNLVGDEPYETTQLQAWQAELTKVAALVPASLPN